MTVFNSTTAKPNSNNDAFVVNPVEMLARLRRHAAAKRGNENGNDENEGIFTDDELRTFISMYVDGKIPDYQMTAWLMAVCFCPLNPRETATLTRCYAESGRIVEWPMEVDPSQQQRPPLVDKHSSGGVGDKISLILAPLVAACGVSVPMMAGRGLGHTGGTIDKLETSFPGYQATPKSIKEFQKSVLEVGCAIVEAGPDLCPADRRIYALRDVTSTVSCLPLMTASIMSKKIAENPDSLVLDVKYGDGAFRDTVEDARIFAESMVAVGEANGLVPTTAFLTDMNHPLGRAVGNWVETAECIDVMKGNLRGSKSLQLSHDLIILAVVQAGQMLYQSRSYRAGKQRDNNNNNNNNRANAVQPYEKYESMSLDECILNAYKVLDSGIVLDKFQDMLLAQGAEPLYLERALKSPDSIPLASFEAVWTYEDKVQTAASGTDDNTSFITYIVNIPAKLIGDVAVDLGTGRRKTGEKVDGQAGLVFRKQTGDSVVHGDVILSLYTNRSQTDANAALERIKASVVFEKRAASAPNPFASKRIVTHKVTKEGGTESFVVPSFLFEKEEESP